MIKRIDIIRSCRSQYKVQHHFTTCLHSALLKLGIESRLFDINEADKFIETMRHDPPDCTLSINGLLPDEQGLIACDITHIPHVSYLIDALGNYFVHLIRSPYSIITCIDRATVDFFNDFGFKRALFMPHAVESSLYADADSLRPYEVVMLASCIDYERISLLWKDKFPPWFCMDLEEGVQMALENDTLSSSQVFEKVLTKLRYATGIDPSSLDIYALLHDFDMYVRGRDRIELLQNIDTAQVHVFGAANWSKYLGHKSNIIIHPPISFTEAHEIMKQSKIVLNSCPTIKNGLHERLLAGIACGALVISSENTCLRAQFAEGISIAFYRYAEWQAVNACIGDYLADEPKRRQVVLAGQQIVKNTHTWELRAAELVNALSPLLEKMT